jgi:hypothetical protein
MFPQLSDILSLFMIIESNRTQTRPPRLSGSRAGFRGYTQIVIIFIFLIQKICVYPPEAD